MPLFRRKRPDSEPEDRPEGHSEGSPSGGDFYEIASHLSFSDERVRVEPREDQSVSVSVIRKDESASVEVYAPDLRRAAYAASLPLHLMTATIRGVGGTVELDGHTSGCRFRVRDYDQEGDVWAQVGVEPLAGLVAFLDDHGGLAASVSAGDGPTAGEFEVDCSNWRPQRLKVGAEGDVAVVVATEIVSDEWEQVETVRVPLESFAAAVRLAGGDLPGRCHFSLRRGSLSAHFDRKTSLSMYVTTDEVDGDTIIAELNGEQLQDLRRHVDSWLQPPPLAESDPSPTD